MDRFVYNIFKTVMLAMIMVFVVDMVFYVSNVFSLKSKIEDAAYLLRKDIAEHNGLDDETSKVYMELFQDIADEYGTYEGNMKGSGSYFVDNIESNAFCISKNNLSSGKISLSEKVALGKSDSGDEIKEVLYSNMKSYNPVFYGDIMCLYIKVDVNAPTWFGIALSGSNAQNWGRSGLTKRTMLFRYFIPALSYQIV